jgi:hypothetical protein
MIEKFIVASASIYQTFTDFDSANIYAKEMSEKNQERVTVFLQCGTMCGAVAEYGEK